VDSFLVTGKESDELVDGYGTSRKPSFLNRYTDILDEACPMYLRAGMSYTDYWDGEPEMAIYYRKKHEQDREYDNFLKWLQGLYIYEAILDLVPAIKPFVKNPEIQPYRNKPLSLTEAEKMQREEEEKAERIKAGRQAMEAAAIAFNKRFKERRENIG
jgi:hypothetical protein